MQLLAEENTAAADGEDRGFVAAEVLLWRCWRGGTKRRLSRKQRGLLPFRSEMRGAAADLCRVEKTRGRGGKLWLSGSVLAKGRVKLWLILGEEKGENPQNGRGGH